MKLLTNEQHKLYQNAKFLLYLKDENYCKVRDHCHYTGEHRGATHSTCILKYSIPKKIPVVFYNGSNYDYHFIIK